MPYNAVRARRVCDRQIRRLGGRVGALQRSTGTRKIMIALIDYRPGQRGDLILEGDRRGVVSTFMPDGRDLTPGPDNEEDVVLLYKPGTTIVEQKLRIATTPGRIDPNGVVIQWELQLRTGQKV
jgi:hypothetical protein